MEIVLLLQIVHSSMEGKFGRDNYIISLLELLMICLE